jgi:hypothetical protein
MAKLSEEMKHFIVTELAQFRAYAEVARLASAEFGVPVDRFQVRSYDPGNTGFSASDRWRDFFNAARARYLSDVDAVPLSHRAYRLNELQQMFARARDGGNLVLASTLLEQAAKEVGGVLTNDRNLKFERANSPLSELTPEERRAMVADMLTQALDKHRQQNPPSTETPHEKVS